MKSAISAKTRSSLKRFVIDLIIIFAAWGPFYEAKLPSSDTIWADISPISDLSARIQSSRWLGYAWDYFCYFVMGYYPQRHYKLTLAIFLFILAVCLYLLQTIFLPLLEDKIKTPARKAAFYALTGLCFVNVLFSELLYFTESFGIFQFSLLFCMLGCLSFTRGHYVRGMISFLIMVCFYQMGAPIAALVLCTWLILRYRCRFSKELLVKELLYIAAPLTAGVIDFLSGGVLNPILASKGVNYSLSKTLDMKAFGLTSNAMEQLKWLYTWSMGLCGIPLLPIFISCVITLFVLAAFIRKRRLNELLTYILFKIVSFTLMFGMAAVTSVFMPRMLITFCIMQACGGLAALYFCPERSRAVSWVPLFYFLVQVFFIQIIIANRQASNSLDIVYAGQVLSKIDAYEEETGVKVTKIAVTEDLYSTDVYPQVHYASGEVNRRNYGWNTRSFLIYECGDYSRFELADMDPETYNRYFAGRDWDEFNADEQIIIEGGTCYVCVF